MSADVARGDSKDYSTFHIIKLETLEIIGEYQGKPTLDMFANMLNTAVVESATNSRKELLCIIPLAQV